MANADNFILWEMTTPNAVIVVRSMCTVLEFSSVKCVSSKTQIQTSVWCRLCK